MSTQDIIEELRDEGRAEGEARALLAVLRVRGIVVPDAARERILAEREPARLERWIEKAVVAASLADVLPGRAKTSRAPGRRPRRPRSRASS